MQEVQHRLGCPLGSFWPRHMRCVADTVQPTNQGVLHNALQPKSRPQQLTGADNQQGAAHADSAHECCHIVCLALLHAVRLTAGVNVCRVEPASKGCHTPAAAAGCPLLQVCQGVLQVDEGPGYPTADALRALAELPPHDSTLTGNSAAAGSTRQCGRAAFVADARPGSSGA